MKNRGLGTVEIILILTESLTQNTGMFYVEIKGFIMRE